MEEGLEILMNLIKLKNLKNSQSNGERQLCAQCAGNFDEFNKIKKS